MIIYSKNGLDLFRLTVGREVLVGPSPLASFNLTPIVVKEHSNSRARASLVRPSVHRRFANSTRSILGLSHSVLTSRAVVGISSTSLDLGPPKN